MFCNKIKVVLASRFCLKCRSRSSASSSLRISSFGDRTDESSLIASAQTSLPKFVDLGQVACELVCTQTLLHSLYLEYRCPRSQETRLPDDDKRNPRTKTATSTSKFSRATYRSAQLSALQLSHRHCSRLLTFTLAKLCVQVIAMEYELKFRCPAMCT